MPSGVALVMLWRCSEQQRVGEDGAKNERFKGALKL